MDCTFFLFFVFHVIDSFGEKEYPKKCGRSVAFGPVSMARPFCRKALAFWTQLAGCKDGRDPEEYEGKMEGR